MREHCTELPAPSGFALLSSTAESFFGPSLTSGFVCAGAELGFFFDAKRSASMSSMSCARTERKSETCSVNFIFAAATSINDPPSCSWVCRWDQPLTHPSPWTKENIKRQNKHKRKKKRGEYDPVCILSYIPQCPHHPFLSPVLACWRYNQ